MNADYFKHSELVQKAWRFAEEKHARQWRKFSGERYFEHPLRVFKIVSEITHDDDTLAAALLHDVVEDTGVPLDDIRREFGPGVATLVEVLTKREPHDDDIEVERLRAASEKAKLVKVADILDNTRDLVKIDPSYAGRYLPKKLRQLEAMNLYHMPVAVLAREQILAQMRRQ